MLNSHRDINVLIRILFSVLIYDWPSFIADIYFTQPKKTAALEGQQREKKDLKVVCVLPDLMDRGVAAFRRPNINLV